MFEIHVELSEFSQEIERQVLGRGWKISCLKTYIITTHAQTEVQARLKLLEISYDIGKFISRKKIEHIIYDWRRGSSTSSAD